MRAARERLRTVTAPRLLIGVGGAVVAVALAAWLLRTPPPPVEASLPVASAAPAADDVATAPTGTIVVQAAGAVVAPGVYHLPAGSRVVLIASSMTLSASSAASVPQALAAVASDSSRSVWTRAPGPGCSSQSATPLRAKLVTEVTIARLLPPRRVPPKCRW